MGVNTHIDISEKDLNNLHELLKRYLPNTKIWAFGSRVKWTSRPDSDLDLVVFTTKEQNRQVHNLKDALQESSLPFRVDVLVWDNIPDTFRENIKQQYFVLVDLNTNRSCGMSSEWSVLTLGELTVNYDTKRKPVKAPDRKTGKYPYYGASGIFDYVEGYIFEGDFLLIAEDGENLRSRQTPIAFMATGKFWVNNHAHIVTGNERANTRFLMYSLLTADVNSFLTGAVMPKLTQGNLNQIPITCPPLEIQERIVGILGALDDRITLLRETNATLEAIAQALFKSWFVDFDPVHAKAQGRQPEGMDEQTATLFPDRFVESELGMVPLGWEVVELVEISEILNGYAFKSEDYIEDENGVFVLRTTNFSDDGYAKRLGKDVFLPMSFTDTHSKYLCEPFDFHLVMVGASVGKTSTLLPNMLPALRNQNMWCFRPKNGFPSRFFIHETVKLKTVEALRSTSGSAREFLRKGDFEKSSVKLPTNDILAVFEDTTLAIKQTIAINESQAQTLVDLRDTLLPRLISGQLRLPDVEA